MRALVRRVPPACLQLVVPGCLLIAWWTLTADGSSFYWPPLREILIRFREDWLFQLVPIHLFPSVYRLTLGFAAGTVLALVLGTVLGLVPLLRATFVPLLDLARSIPGAALIPAAFFLFGIDDGSKIAIVVWATFWPVLLNTIDGIRGVDPTVYEFARAFRLSRLDAILHVILPWASPQIAAGIRVAVGISLLTLVVSEMFISTSGLGYYIAYSQSLLRIREMWSAIIVLMVIASLMNVVFLIFERRTLRWHRGWRGISPEMDPGRS